MCAIILLELVVLRQYLKLDPSADAELYEASRVLTDREYDELDDGEHALRARVVREPTIHEQAFQSTAPNFSGMREHRWDEDAGSGRDQAKRAHQNASHLFESQGLHLGRKLDRHGTVPVEHPSDLTKVLSEDGSPYVFGTVNHLWKDHMTLFGSLPRRPPSPTSSIPRPFPLATPSKDQVPVKFPSKDGKPVKAKLRIKIPAQSKGPSSKPIVASKVEGKKSKVQSTLSFAPRILRMATMEKRTHSRRESKDSEEQDGMGTPTVKKAKTG